MYILKSFSIVNQYHAKTYVFFFSCTKKQHGYKCDIDFVQKFIKEEFNMNTLTF